MYKEIETIEELNALNQFWGSIADEMGFIKESAPLEKSKKYLFFDNDDGLFDVKKDEILGTVEINPYNPTGYTTIGNEEFLFSSYDVIQSNQENTYELDKFAVNPSKRGKGVCEEILSVIANHTEETGGQQYIMLIEYKFSRLLKMGFGVPLVELLKVHNPYGDNRKGIREGKTLVVPALVRVRKKDGTFEPWYYNFIQQLKKAEKQNRKKETM